MCMYIAELPRSCAVTSRVPTWGHANLTRKSLYDWERVYNLTRESHTKDLTQSHTKESLYFLCIYNITLSSGRANRLQIGGRPPTSRPASLAQT